MHDAGKIIAGLAIFLALVISPMWYHSVRGGESGPPVLRISKTSRQCVEPTEYMKIFHMDLLNKWRDSAVRDGERRFVGFDGQVYEKSLAGTCLGSCHSNRAEFCDRCHEYVGAHPYCWECHDEKRGQAAAEVRSGGLRTASVAKRSG